ncbi:MAG: hypothetical protein V1901_03890 [Patescibacteria group bacterium]
MENLPSQAIIIGGGSSLKTGISLGLKDLIKDRFVITTNFGFNFFDSSFTTFVDYDFYNGNIIPDSKGYFTIQDKSFVEKLKQLPLLIGSNEVSVIEKIKLIKYPNTILIKSNSSYSKDIKKGLFKCTLCGVFTLSLVQWLMDFSGEIYCCGYDWTVQQKEKLNKKYTSHYPDVETHFYSDKEMNHRGQHFVGYFQNHYPQDLFKYFNEPNIKIYNVNPQSNIQSFEKITYEQMFKKLNNETFNQDNLRQNIKEKINASLS